MVAKKKGAKSAKKGAKPKAAKKAAPKKAAPKKAAPKKAAMKKVAPKKAAPKKAAVKKAAPVAAGRVVVQNVNVPGHKTTVDAVKYEAMRGVLLAALPKSPPGITQAEMLDAVTGKLPEAVFPGQEKAGWWMKCVQLDLEAKGAMKRTATKPLRWHAS